MNGRAIFAIILLASLVGVMIYLFLKFEKPQQELVEQYVNISISASDENTPDNNIIVGYEISGTDSNYFKSGSTFKYGAVLEKIPFNHSYQIKTVPENNESYDYYSGFSTFDTFSYEPIHVKFLLQKPGIVRLTSNNSLYDNNLSLNVKLKSGEYYKNIIFCTTWGLHVVRINFESEFNEITNPVLYQNYDKCFETKRTLTDVNNSLIIPFHYKYIGMMDEQDFISFVIMDSDVLNGEYLTSYNTKDIGGVNQLFEFKIV